MWNGHSIFIYIYIYIEHRNLETWKHLWLLSSGTKLFITFLSFKVLRHKERYTLFLFWLFHFPHPIWCGTCPRLLWASESQPSSPRQVSTRLTDFFKVLRASGPWRHSYLLALFSIWAIVMSLSNMSAPRTQTPVLMLHLSNPCTEPKGSQPY